MPAGILRLLLRKLILLENPDAEQKGAESDNNNAGAIHENQGVGLGEILKSEIGIPGSGTGSRPHLPQG